MTRRLIIDTHNILYRIHAMNQKNMFGSAKEKAMTALQTSLLSIYKQWKIHNPDQIVFAFEGDNNWRKLHTKSSSALTTKGYKANRVKDESFIPFFELIASFKDLIRNHTSFVVLEHDLCEGDDLIAGFAQRFAPSGDEIVIISTDKDFVQLLKYPTVKVIDPASGIPRAHENIEYFLFEKCIRGDTGDNVGSAFPKVKKTRIQAAFENEYDRVNLMNEQWILNVLNKEGVVEEKINVVGDLYKENKLLMDLEAQPTHVRIAIDETIDSALKNIGKFNQFFYVKFLKTNGLDMLVDSLSTYQPMLECKIKQNNPVTESILQY